MKKTIFLWLFLMFALTGISQVITIKDSETKEPLELATLAEYNARTFVVTNANGQADISTFEGSEKIEIRMIGYKTRLLSFAEIKNLHFNLSLEKSTISLDQVVISATRWKQNSREIPASMVTITPQEIALQNPQTAADMLAISGEVFMQKSQQGGGSPMIRGFSTNRLLYTVDGVRMNTAIFRSGNLQNVISLDPFTIEDAEVIFGPVSLIYGSDAIGGVMSFQTLSPQYSLDKMPQITGNAATRYSSANDEITGHFDVNVGWKKWALVTSFTSNKYGDLRMGSNGPDEYRRPWYVKRIDSTDVVVTNEDPLVQKPSGYSQINMMQKIGFKPNEHWEFQYAFHYSTTSNYSRFDRLIRTKKGLPRSAEWYYGPQVWMMNNFNITNSKTNAIYDEMTIRLAQQFFEESRHDRDFQSITKHNRFEKVNALSANIDFTKSIGEKHQLYYGLEAVLDDVNSNGTEEKITTGEIASGPSRYPQSTWSSYAVYLSYQFRITQKVLFQAGARYNYYTLNSDFSNNLDYYPLPFSEAKINNGALTGNVGFVFNPTEKWSIILNGSTGFRSPNVDDIGKIFDSEPGSVVVPNPNLKSEYAYNVEAGFARVFDNSVKLDFTAYYTLLNNAMVRRDYTLNGQDSIMYDGEMSKVQAIQNAAKATVYGFQVGLEVKLPAGFGISSHFNYQKGEEELDDGSTSPLRHAAPWFGITHLTYNSGRLTLDLSGVYNGKLSYANLPVSERGKDYLYAIDDDGNPYSPAWYTLNLKARYLLSDIFTVTAGIENLTDQRYRPYSSGISTAGRNFIIALRARF